MTPRPYSILNQDLHQKQLTAEYVADALQVLVQTQQDLQEQQKYTQTDDEHLRTAFLALIAETTELLQELRWKPWALKDSRGRRRRVNRELIIEETADIFLVLGNILAILQEDYEVTPLDVMEAYTLKIPELVEKLRKQRV